MCSHYQGIKQQETCRKVFGVEPPAVESKEDMRPYYQGVFIRRHSLRQSGRGSFAMACLTGQEACPDLMPRRPGDPPTGSCIPVTCAPAAWPMPCPRRPGPRWPTGGCRAHGGG